MKFDKNILVYTEESHDTYTRNIINLIIANNYKVYLITENPKYERLKKTDYKMMENIVYIELKSRKIKSIKGQVDKFLKVFRIYSILKNCVIFKKTMKRNEFSTILFLEDYDKHFIRFLSRYLRGHTEPKKILTVHHVDKHMLGSQEEMNLLKKYSIKLPKKIDLNFANNFDHYIVLTQKIQENLLYFAQKKSSVIPFSLTEEVDIELRSKGIETLNKKEKTLFIVPGNISNQRKKYMEIINAFSRLNSKDYNLTFLGRVVDTEIIEYAIEKEVKILYFNHYIEDDEFREIITSAHFLLGIISDKMPYGIFQASGVEFDGPKYGVPVIVNTERVASEKGIYLQTDDLLKTLEELVEDWKNGLYYEKYGKPAFEKMKENKLDDYVDIMKEILS